MENMNHGKHIAHREKMGAHLRQFDSVWSKYLGLWFDEKGTENVNHTFLKQGRQF